MRRKFVIRDEYVRDRAVAAVREVPVGMAVEIKPPTRSLEQNAKLHALLEEVAQQVEWRGMKLSKDVWKRLCTASMLRERGESPMLIPSLDDHGIEIIYEKTSQMDTRMMADLIEWVYAFGTGQGVVWRERLTA